jgi:fructose/tagatose bisphosphate aldolase
MNIDNLAYSLAFSKGMKKKKAYKDILALAKKKNLKLASIHHLYIARAKEKLPLDFTVPAINLRGMTYDMAQSVFNAANKKNVWALIFELARSEMGYTDQPPMEYAGVVIAAALKTGFQGPLFIQGDHFQVKKIAPGVPEKNEIKIIKQFIKDSINAGFYNIDIDCSTLVDYSKKDVYDQQQPNFKYSAELANYIRSIEPKGITISLGGEIGHIGGKNSTEEELRAYIKGFNKLLKKGNLGLSKISIQTGTHHGGVVLPDGSLADVDVDFDTLKNLARVSRKLGMAGTVQHGASTLPDEYFAQFPKAEAIEVHLATGFQNIVMDHKLFPKQLLNKMYQWLDKEKTDERKKDQTNEQFHYKLRKKAWGQFKKDCWQLPEKIKKPIKQALEKRFAFMFRELNVENTKKIVEDYLNE